MRAGRPPLELQVVENAPKAHEGVLRLGRQRIAGRRQLQGAVQPLEQGKAEMGFEALDLVADRGRRDRKLARGLLEAAEARGGLERPQRSPGQRGEVGHRYQMN